MKKYFITGLIILLPLALTLAIVNWVFNLLTAPFVGVIRSIFHRYDLLENGFLFLSADQVQLFLSKLIILGLLFSFTIFLGMVTRWFFFRYLIRFWDMLVARIPLISTIYKTFQDVVNTIFTSKDKSFKQVVMVPFPDANTRSIGLVTRDDLPTFRGPAGVKTVAVFVPTTPNPTSGFLVMYPESDLIYLDMTIESALKYIISCGVIGTAFKSISKEEAALLAKAEKPS
jgi:uncharacterized membrane protein